MHLLCLMFVRMLLPTARVVRLLQSGVTLDSSETGLISEPRAIARYMVSKAGMFALENASSAVHVSHSALGLCHTC